MAPKKSSEQTSKAVGSKASSQLSNSKSTPAQMLGESVFNDMLPQTHGLTHKALCNPVWSKPAELVAADLGISGEA
jgi:hypothetical protein